MTIFNLLEILFHIKNDNKTYLSSCTFIYDNGIENTTSVPLQYAEISDSNVTNFPETMSKE